MLKTWMKLAILNIILILPAYANLNLALPDTHGIASWYGVAFQGHTMANGKRFNRNAYTCASRVYPFGTTLSVYYPRTHLTVTVVVTDRGPWVKHRIIDLAERPAITLGLLRDGIGYVEVKPTHLEGV